MSWQVRHSRQIGMLPSRYTAMEELLSSAPVHVAEVFRHTLRVARTLPCAATLGTIERIVGRANQKSSTVFFIQQSCEYRLGIESRQTAPNDFAVAAHQCGELAISDQSEFFQEHATSLAKFTRSQNAGITVWCPWRTHDTKREVRKKQSRLKSGFGPGICKVAIFELFEWP